VTEPGPAPTAKPLGAGEQVLLIDSKDRRYLVRLAAGSSFQTHAGVIDHDEIIGGPEGVSIIARRKDQGESPRRRLLVLRPTLADLILKMPRGAQVIYPKDLGAILFAADLYPGARVLEAGVGSGALSMAALRAGCEVLGYEIRPDFAARARANVAAVFGDEVRYTVELRDIYDGIGVSDLDRVLLDLPEPWRAVKHVEKALRPGGILLAYLPTINQTSQLRAALARGSFALAETLEVLERRWHVEGRSVRPDHRMVAHTGFLTSARLVRPGATNADVAEAPGLESASDGEPWGTDADDGEPEERDEFARDEGDELVRDRELGPSFGFVRDEER
jgi:tRNA (adenine57-N1/adenine58-N1)-methyltransferase